MLVLYNSNYICCLKQQNKENTSLCSPPIANASFIGQFVIGTKLMIFKTIMDKSGWEVTELDPELVPVFRDTVLIIYQEGKTNFKIL